MADLARGRTVQEWLQWRVLNSQLLFWSCSRRNSFRFYSVMHFRPVTFLLCLFFRMFSFNISDGVFTFRSLPRLLDRHSFFCHSMASQFCRIRFARVFETVLEGGGQWWEGGGRAQGGELLDYYIILIFISFYISNLRLQLLQNTKKRQKLRRPNDLLVGAGIANGGGWAESVELSLSEWNLASEQLIIRILAENVKSYLMKSFSRDIGCASFLPTDQKQ